MSTKNNTNETLDFNCWIIWKKTNNLNAKNVCNVTNVTRPRMEMCQNNQPPQARLANYMTKQTTAKHMWNVTISVQYDLEWPWMTWPIRNSRTCLVIKCFTPRCFVRSVTPHPWHRGDVGFMYLPSLSSFMSTVTYSGHPQSGWLLVDD